MAWIQSTDPATIRPPASVFFDPANARAAAMQS